MKLGIFDLDRVDDNDSLDERPDLDSEIEALDAEQLWRGPAGQIGDPNTLRMKVGGGQQGHPELVERDFESQCAG